MNDAHDNAATDREMLERLQAAPTATLVTQREQADELAVQLGTQLHRALTALQLAQSYASQITRECPDVTLHPELSLNLRRLAAEAEGFADMIGNQV